MKTLEEFAWTVFKQIEQVEDDIILHSNVVLPIILAALEEAYAMGYESMKKAASPVTENEKEDDIGNLRRI